VRAARVFRIGLGGQRAHTRQAFGDELRTARDQWRARNERQQVIAASRWLPARPTCRRDERASERSISVWAPPSSWTRTDRSAAAADRANVSGRRRLWAGRARAMRCVSMGLELGSKRAPAKWAESKRRHCHLCRALFSRARPSTSARVVGGGGQDGRRRRRLADHSGEQDAPAAQLAMRAERPSLLSF
jgi:hypothetical protein